MELLVKEFQLLRPEWLFMLIPLLILVWLFWQKKLFSRDWESVIDPRLLAHLLVGKSARKSIGPVLFWLSIGLIVVFVLSGPAWKKLPLPVFKQQSALVIVLDLSRSMNTQDVKPSRLVRARLKLLDLLKQRQEGQTALIVFAATAYTVSPLTDDTDTIQSLVSSLTTDLMPVQGSRTDLAIVKALELFQNAGIQQGDILLISDGVSAKSLDKLQWLDLDDFRVSVIAAGTPQGAPIPEQSGGFLKDNDGSIVIAQTDRQTLRSLASSHGGVYQTMSLDDTDINRVQRLFAEQNMSMQHEQTDFTADRWREEGPWILLLLTPLVALVFRRGIFLSVLLAFIIFPMPEPVLAQDLSTNWPSWDSLWKNTNQRAGEALQLGDAEKAAELFDRADWKAASFYKAGQYEQALEQLGAVTSADGSYNQGNTLAKMGRLEEALKSYDAALKQQPEHEDAVFNRKLVEDALKKQQQQEQQQKDGEKNNQDQQQSDQQNQDQQQQDQQNAEQSDEQSQNDSNSEQNANNQQQQDQEEVDQQQVKQDEKDKAEDAEKMKQQEAEQQQAEAKQNEAKEPSGTQDTESLSEQAEAQWLRRIPDDPGGLLRNKFKYQYGRQQQPSQEKESW